MGFGTFTLFNFLQQPNTGITPAPNAYDPTPIVQGAGRDGAVADFNWSFPYAGNLVPYEIVEGGGAVYQVRLLCDSDVGGNSVGVHMPTVYSVLSGKFEGGAEKGYGQLVLSGQFFQQATESGTSKVIFSGLITGQTKESSYQRVMMSGDFSSSQPDSNSYSLVLSGALISSSPDKPNIKHILSGSLESGNAQYNYVNCLLSGSFTPTLKDSTNVSYSVLSFTTLTNPEIIVEESEDEFSVTYGLSSYLSSRP